MTNLPFGFAESVARMGNLMGLQPIKEELLPEATSIEAVYHLSQLAAVQARDEVYYTWIQRELGRKGKSLCLPFSHTPRPIWRGSKTLDLMSEIELIGEIYCTTKGAAGNIIELRAGMSAVIDIKVYHFTGAMACHLIFSFASEMVNVPLADPALKAYPLLMGNFWSADANVFGYAIGLALLRKMDWDNNERARTALSSLSHDRLVEYRQRTEPQQEVDWR